MGNVAVILCVVALATLAGQAPATPVLEGSAPLSLTEAGGTGTVTISLAGAETGLSGYNLTLRLSNRDTGLLLRPYSTICEKYYA